MLSTVIGALDRDHEAANSRPAGALEFLPGRTWIGICRHAAEMGLHRRKSPNGSAGVPKRAWEDWEIDLLRQYYEARISKQELEVALQHRRWDTIKAKANRLGLRWVERKSWEPQLRWEEVPPGTFDLAVNVTTVLDNEPLPGPATRSWSDCASGIKRWRPRVLREVTSSIRGSP